MIEEKSAKKYITIAFIAVETVLYAVFLSLDCIGKDSTAYKYVGVTLCLLYVILIKQTDVADYFLMVAALTFTALADAFLLVLNNYYLLGVLSFCVVQTIYFARFVRTTPSRFTLWCTLRICSVFVVWLVLYLMEMFNALTAVTIFYFVNLFYNCLQSYLYRKKMRNGGLLLAIGLTLFLCCDICVGLNNLSAFVTTAFPQGLARFVSIGMWAFYMPSQTLIAISCKIEEK